MAECISKAAAYVWPQHRPIEVFDYRATPHVEALAAIEEYENFSNLTRMWKAAGCPEGRDPQTWASKAAPVLAAHHEYLKATLGETDPDHPILDQPGSGSDEAVVPVDPEFIAATGDEYADEGDLIAYPEVALLYAEFLSPRTALYAVGEMCRLIDETMP